jgi:hypothetical protein
MIAAGTYSCRAIFELTAFWDRVRLDTLGDAVQQGLVESDNRLGLVQRGISRIGKGSHDGCKAGGLERLRNDSRRSGKDRGVGRSGFVAGEGREPGSMAGTWKE